MFKLVKLPLRPATAAVRNKGTSASSFNRAMSARKCSPKSADRLSTLDPSGTVFAEFTGLAIEHNAVNLGQGFPTLPVPEFITNAAIEACKDINPLHQYTRSEGHVRLVKAVSAFYSDKIGRTLDPLTEIITTVGATEALYSAIQAFVNPGDQVILMQPFYDSYPAAITLAGGVPVMVSLTPSKPALSSADWRFDINEIRRAIVPGKTKMIMINNPHNPIGKVFERSELAQIAAVAEEFDLLVIADEVYETLVYDDSSTPLIKFGSLPGMAERTITVGSVGKMFGVTGWKIGWCLSTPEIIRSIWMVHQYVPFSVVTPLQEATAVALEKAMTNDYFERNVAEYQSLRNKLHGMLSSVGLTPTMPQGGYFILADTTSVPDDAAADPTERRRDFRVCRYLTKEAGVAPIPVSAFYAPEAQTGEVPAQLARFAFCKNADMLDRAGEKLASYGEKEH
ncbi:pyridoxal phosphate-dependent transferase [Blyttiomyces helicus]|uniref:Pyridoxal phosphate-dependent transferase n=1 Tax=Blyttiomyces helicus TaxID=388810 RepID=A0A4P9WL89_9FUNG|nr:pyridoxal phosphate-dependent transferase [Blyttiomyces helicus]|eukprot:RKO92833.1 pyridoxal phosphate-dependent transferase [Blyttiomyces helicus]